MIEVLNEHNISNRITFPVRALFAAESGDQMSKLLDDRKNSTLTLWSGPNDNVNVDKLRKMIANVGVHRMFVDVPEELKSKLRLHDLPKSTGLRTLATSLPIMLITLIVFI